MDAQTRANWLETMAKADSAKNGQGKKGGFGAFLGYPGVSRDLSCESFSTTGENSTFTNENNSQPVDKNDAFYSPHWDWLVNCTHKKARHFNTVTITD